MKNALCTLVCTFYLLTFCTAQDTPYFYWWDYRSSTWLNGRMGIGFTFGNQNRQFYFFTETDLCGSCIGSEYIYRPENIHQHMRRNRFRGNFHLRFQTSKDFRLFGTSFNNSRDEAFKSKSWTYLTSVGASVDFGLYQPGKIANLETGRLDEDFRKKTKLRFRYDILSRYYSYYYRKLSNSVGNISLHISALDDRWGTGISWGNDFFLTKTLQSAAVTYHDHGETNAVFINVWARPYESKYAEANMTKQYAPETLQKLDLTFSSRLITDRNISKSSLNNQMRAGMYDVLGLENAFHGYHGVKLQAEGNIYHAFILLGVDNLHWGRNIQRFAHQGYAHLPGRLARTAIRKIDGTNSPLFPWESQPLYYKKSRFYWESGGSFSSPFVRYF